MVRFLLCFNFSLSQYPLSEQKQNALQPKKWFFSDWFSSKPDQTSVTLLDEAAATEELSQMIGYSESQKNAPRLPPTYSKVVVTVKLTVLPSILILCDSY